MPANCAKDINVPSKIRQLGLFDFRAFLNMAMLLSESEKARALRQLMLDIVIDLINRRTGGGTKYINQRDKDYIGSALQEENYCSFAHVNFIALQMATKDWPLHSVPNFCF